jgi:hypothetical protein
MKDKNRVIPSLGWKEWIWWIFIFSLILFHFLERFGVFYISRYFEEIGILSILEYIEELL